MDDFFTTLRNAKFGRLMMELNKAKLDGDSVASIRHAAVNELLEDEKMLSTVSRLITGKEPNSSTHEILALLINLGNAIS